MSQFPYPGLRPFHRDETDIFFGREEQVDRLLDKLDSSRFLAVVGPSGCGKSSLVRAGMIAALEAGFLASAGAHWRIAEMRPGDRPLRRLCEALLTEAALADRSMGASDAMAFVYAMLRRGPLGLVEALQQTPLPERTNLLVLVDQFEEIFRYHQQGGRDEADAFVALLLATAAQRDIPVYVVITMRSDFLGECALFTGLPEVMNESQFLTPRLTREQRRAAIEGPARVFGGKIESTLVNRLLNDMGAAPDQLPLMQHVLMRMWNRRRSVLGSSDTVPDTVAGWEGVEGLTLTLTDYMDVGGLSDALSRHADEAIEELDQEQRHVAEVLFRCLCERGENQRDTRRPVQLDIMVSVAKTSFAHVVSVIEVFRHPDRSFLTPSVETPLQPDTVVDISHESLIRQWRQLDEWVQREASSAAVYRRLRETAHLWKDGGAGLWSRPDLDIALDWKERENVPETWAERYGGDFELAMAFLQASIQERDDKQHQEEAAQQRALVQAQVLAEAERQRAEAQARRAEAERQRAEAQVRRAEAERQRAEEQARAAKLWKYSVVLFIVVLLAATGSAGIAWKMRQNRQEAEATKRESVRNLYESRLMQAAWVARDEDYANARQILDKTDELDAAVSVSRRHTRNALSWFVDTMGGKAPDPVGQVDVALKAIAAHPDRKLLAAVGEKGTVALFDADSKQSWRLKGHDVKRGATRGVVFHLNGQWLITAGDDGRILFWPTDQNGRFDEDGSREFLLSDKKTKIWALALNKSGTRLASGDINHEIKLWDIETLRDTERREPLHILKGHSGAIEPHGLAFSPDGSLIAGAASDDTVRIWDVETGRPRCALDPYTGEVLKGRRVAFSPDGTLLATGSADRIVRLWRLVGEDRGNRSLSACQGKQASYLERLHMLQGHKKEVMNLAFVTNKMLVSTSLDNTLRVWDTDSGVTLRVLKGHTAGVFGVAADTHHLFSVSQDQNVYRWELDDLMRIVHLDGQPSSTVIAPDGDRIVIGLENGTLRLYRLPDFSRPVKEVLKAHTKAISRLVFSRDGQFLLSAGLLTPTVNLWEVHSDQLKWKQQFTVKSDGVVDIAFAPSAEMFVAVNVDGGIHLFNIREKKGHLLNDLQGMDVESVAFDAKDQNLVFAIKKGFGESAGKGGVLLGKLDQGSLADRVEVPLPTSTEYATISPDGQRVASVGSDQLLRILRRDTGKETMQLSGHKNFIRRAVFSPDGEMVATIGDDATIRMWDLLKERELFTIRLPAAEDRPFPFRDFDYRCQSIPVSVSAQACWIAVPLDDKKLVLYDLSRIYN